MQETKQTKLKEIVLDESQVRAVNLGIDVKKRIVSISGKPGVGKTTLMKTIYEQLTSAGYNIICAAPTGKAARRIQEATGCEAVTIHKLLEYPHPGERDERGNALRPTDPKRHRHNPIDYDGVLCDEYAMVNHEVHRNLVNALPNRGFIRCFGDVFQLPPIERNKQLQDKPSPFMDILSKFDSIFLDTIHRQGEDSGIITNCERMLKGQMPQRLSDFTVAITDKATAKLKEAVNEFAEQGIMFETLDNQIITPAVKTWVGTTALNGILQSMYRDELEMWLEDVPRPRWHKNPKPLRLTEKDKVVWTENDYQLGVMNGETGIVTEIYPGEGALSIDFGDRVIDVPPHVEYVDFTGATRTYDPRTSLDLAYALTTHKCQGSEYKTGIYVLNRSSFYNQNRNNFYTAAARNKQHVRAISDQRSLQTSVTKVEKNVRAWLSMMREKGVKI